MAQVKLATNGIGGSVINGQFGNYQAASDGTVTVDSRDVPALLAAGMGYITNAGDFYTTPAAPAAATAGQIVASAALSTGAVSIANQPDVMRQVQFVFGTGTVAISAGAVSVTYVGQDQASHTDTLNPAVAASASVTISLSRGVASITTINVGSFTGGASPWIRADTTASIAVQSDPNAVDFVCNIEYDVAAKQTTPATFSTSSQGCIAPQNAPNATRTFSFAYAYLSPAV